MKGKLKEQLPLGLRYEANGHTELRDAAAAENKALPVHRWVPWIAGFSAPFVEDAIDAYLPKRRLDAQVVLDPFAGVGTTLVEALKSGRHTLGYEINPFAALAATAKVNSIDASPRLFESKVAELRAALFQEESRIDRAWIKGGASSVMKLARHLSAELPQGFRSRIPFFSPPVEAKFLLALHHVNLMHEPFRAIFRVALGATMVSFSNYTYEPSLSSRPGAGKSLIDNAPVAHIICTKLETMLTDIALMRSSYGIWKTRSRNVENHSYFDASLPRGSVSLVVTSPPYMNNYHYVRNTRPQLHWLGLIAGRSLAHYEEQNFGKFWQTVRQGPPVRLDVGRQLSVARLVDELRGIAPERRAYGGNGWANYVATYFNDCQRFLVQLKRHLKPGARAVIVVGNSIIQGIEFKVDEVLAELAEANGLTAEERIVVRNKRVGNSIIDSTVRNGNGSHKKRTQLYDAAVILRR